jgi:hypothetical protein
MVCFHPWIPPILSNRPPVDEPAMTLHWRA